MHISAGIDQIMPDNCFMNMGGRAFFINRFLKLVKLVDLIYKLYKILIDINAITNNFLGGLSKLKQPSVLAEIFVEPH